MASLKAIRAAVVTTIETQIPSLTGYPTVPDAANTPAFVVEPVDADFEVAMGRGTDTWNFNLHVLASFAVSELGQDALDEYVTGAGSKSIRQVVFNNKTLGLTNTTAHIAGLLAGSYGAQFETASIQHVGATLRLVVHTLGTE